MTGKKPDLTKAALHGTFWAYASRYGGKFLVFISTTILARLLAQEDFGIAGYALVMIGFLEVLEGLGVGSAVIYYGDDEERLNTAFWLGLAVGISLFGLSWIVAPLAGAFFQDPRAVPVTRMLGLEFPISALGLVPSALLTKRLAFGRKFVPDIARAIFKGVASIAFALMGFGAWSLIWGQLIGLTVEVIVYWVVVPWRPAFRFSRHLFTSLFSYGTSIVSVDALGILLLNVDYLLIGRFMGAAALGTYTLAFRVPELLIKQFSGIVSRVTFPVYTKMKEDPQALRYGFLTTMRYLTMITIPLGLGLALVSKPFVIVFFTEKWAEAIPVMSAISLYTLFRSLFFNAGGVYKAQGRPGLLTKLSLLQAVVSIPVLWWVVVQYNSIVAVAWAQVALVAVAGLVKLAVAGRLLHISLKKFFTTLYPALTAGSLMAIGVFTTSQFLQEAIPLVELLADVLVGVLIYSGALWWLQREEVLRAGTMLRAAFLPKVSQASQS
jgi:PST family polysaccharide transporter